MSDLAKVGVSIVGFAFVSVMIISYWTARRPTAPALSVSRDTQCMRAFRDDYASEYADYIVQCAVDISYDCVCQAYREVRTDVRAHTFKSHIEHGTTVEFNLL